jgi:large subunit ribosomal protein L7e
MVDGIKKPLSDNITVENALAEKNMICLSDLSHEIFNVGDNFEDACKFLCTFNLASPVGHYEKEVLRVHDKEEKGGFLTEERMEAFLSKII